MPEYRIGPDARDDLLDIALYTLETWGHEQTERYERRLIESFEQIAGGNALSKAPIHERPELRATRCEHHFVFWMRDPVDASVEILAILHENMDLMTRIRSSLDDDPQI